MKTRAKTTSTPECPACSHKRGTNYVINGRAHHGVYECARCSGIHGRCYLGESYAVVLPRWADKDPGPEAIRYFDFVCLGSGGITRRHGWFDPETKLIVQTG